MAFNALASPARGAGRAAGGPTGPFPDRAIVLVGLMGAGKTSVGRLLAARLGREFADADDEVAAAAGCSVEDIFSRYGEAAFRDGERRVMARLLGRRRAVIAAGGGAFNDPGTREAVRREGVSVWLRADLDLLLGRVSRRGGRPLLAAGNERAVLERLMAERAPFYAEADVTVDVGSESPRATMDRVLRALEARRRPRDGGTG